MIGWQSHADPWGLLPTVDRDVYGEMENPPAASSRRELLRAYGEYCDATRGRYGVTRDGYAVPSARHLMHPVQNLFRGEPNAKRWRRAVDDALKRQNPRETVSELIDRTLKESAMSDETLDAPPEARWARKGGSELTREEASFEKKQRYARAVERLASVPPAPPRIEASDA
jgi:tRNA-dihydrouridine synthase A